jgi:CheY-like chemotaxis protein
VKLVAMTGFGQSSDRVRAKEAGYHQHVVKPPTVDVLKGILESEGG